MSSVSEEYKHIFVHIPKTAGSAMENKHWVGGTSHMSIKNLVNEENKEYFKWAFVRNPFDRLWSAYKYLKNVEHWDKYPDNLVRRMQFKDVCNRLDSLAHIIVHLAPQHYFLFVDGISAMDYIGHYENLREDWEFICRKVIGKNDPLPVVNGTGGCTYDHVYTPDMIEQVAEFYAKDIQYFYPSVSGQPSVY